MLTPSRSRLAWLAALPLAALVLAACTTELRTEGDGGQRSLAVDGQGQVTAAPDVAILNVGVSVLRDSVSEAQSDASSAMSAVLESLRANGVEDEDITTTQFNIFPEFDFSRDGERDLLGFRVFNEVSVKIREVDAAGDVIDAAVTAAGDDVIVNSIRFTIDDPTELVDAARELAVEDAARKAEALADLADVGLGDVLEIRESGGGAPQPVAFEGRAIAAVEAFAAPPPIAGGQVAVSVFVFVTYAID